MTTASPFTVEALADRWGVSATTIRTQCNEGKLRHFRLGRLYRIPASFVEEVEACQTSTSVDFEGDSASSGKKTENEDVISLRHAPERKPNRKQ
ncbi:helix-turn-helix domain-containing protein [Shimia sp. Alg240-R146]|uniref:helix-turn-helix domain-containing protein n=1 Tax=Shimia sp. Alg240-R146 TaxID=2993449 RepID=UPI003376096F|nr:helix-turn-helix domain-containing protein [Shimia sp.]